MTDVLLMTPGPVPLSRSVQHALAQPAEYHHDGDFYSALEDCRLRLARLVGCDGTVTVMPGSGRVGIEAAIATTVTPGDRTLHLVNGFFGRWPATMAERAGAVPDVLEGPEDRGFPLERAVRAVDEAARNGQPYQLLTVTHCETSTAQLTAVADLVAVLPQDRPLVLVDAISSVPGAPLDMRNDSVDLCVLGTQKALGAPMGLAVVAISQHVLDRWARRRRAPGTWAYDLNRWLEFDAVDMARPYPVVPSTHLVRALHAALVELDGESSDERLERQAAAAARARTTLEAGGLSVYGHDPSPTVTPVAMPGGIVASEVSRVALRQGGVQLAGGMGRVKERIVRIPHMGLQAREAWQWRAIAAVVHACASLGAAVDEAGALAAFERAAKVPEPPASALEAQP